MSSFISQARARALRPTLSLPRPRLTVVPRAVSRAPRVPFVALVVSVLAVGLVGLLLLNTSLQTGAYRLTDLRSSAAALTLRQQNLQMQVAALQDPQLVAQKAVRLGMVANDSPAFLSLSTGRLIGVSVPGQADHQVDIGHKLGPRVDHLSKIAAGAGGSASAVGTGALLHTVPPVHTKPGTKGADTHGTSDGSGRAADTKGRQHRQ